MENAQTSASKPRESAGDDVVVVTTTRVMCEGSGGALGHPRTYLDMGSDSSVTCKYCGRVFKLDPNASSSGHH